MALAAASPCRAHPADESGIYHYLWLKVEPGRVTVQQMTEVGGLLTQTVWPLLDRNGDHDLSRDEQEHSAETLAEGLTLELNGKPVPLKLDAYEFPTHAAFFGGGMTGVKLTLAGKLPPGAAAGTLRLRDDTYPRFAAIFPRPQVAAEGVGTGEPHVSEEGRLTDLQFAPTGSVLSSAERSASRRLNTPGLELDPGLNFPPRGARKSAAPSLDEIDPNEKPLFPESGKTVWAAPPRSRESAESAQLKGFLNRPLTPGLIILGLGTALLLGAAHALEPGHGKSMVAAYLVGSRGTVWDAILLGITVTVTHTLGVYLLGFLCLWLTTRIEAEVVAKWLSIGSGLLVLGMGFWLFQRGLLWYHGVPTGGHSHDAPGGDSHGHSHGHMHAHSHEQPMSEEGGGRSEGRRPPKDSPREDPKAAHHHEHGQRYDRWGIVTLGIAGGMVPCPAATAVLIAAVNLRQIPVGLAIIGAFSVGMALTLITIGVVMVTAKDFVRSRIASGGESRFVRAMPAVSGAVLFFLGAWLTLSSLAQAGFVRLR